MGRKQKEKTYIKSIIVNPIKKEVVLVNKPKISKIPPPNSLIAAINPQNTFKNSNPNDGIALPILVQLSGPPKNLFQPCIKTNEMPIPSLRNKIPISFFDSKKVLIMIYF